MFLKKSAIVIVLFFLVGNLNKLHADDYIKGSVIDVNEDNISVELETGEVILVEIDQNHTVSKIQYDEKDPVIIQKFEINDSLQYVITDFNRRSVIYALFGLFAVLALFVGKQYGLFSILGMFFSFLVVFNFMLPNIINGKNPIIITIVSSLFIIPLTFYPSHGIKTKTHVAVISTLISLIITSLLAALSVNISKLTGFASDESTFLYIANENINMKGILLSGIIIGFLGVLDDVTVSQASIVMKLKKANKSFNAYDLYVNSMEIGRDHIASMINTLVLVYAGASMPLLLMFVTSDRTFLDVINNEIIAEEIIRTLVGSIGLIISVPISTLIASFVAESD